MTISMTKREKTFGWIFLALTPLVLPVAIVGVCQLADFQLDEGQLNCLIFGINCLLTLLIFHHFLWKNAVKVLSDPWRSLRWAGIGFAIYYGSSMLVNLLISVVAPDFANANDASILTMVQEHFVLMTVGTVFLVPITEETLYRGLVFGALLRKNRILAYGLSMAIFSALHVVGYIGTMPPLHLLLSFLQYLPGGFALALAYDKSGSIWTSILIHMTINQISILSLR